MKMKVYNVGCGVWVNEDRMMHFTQNNDEKIECLETGEIFEESEFECVEGGEE